MNTVVPAYKWAKLVKERWGNKCIYCGKDVFGSNPLDRLEAHHIKSRYLYPEIENDIMNGVALCHKCHMLAHGGNFYNAYRENENKPYDERSERIIRFIDSANGLIRADLGLAEDEWRGKDNEG